MGNPSVLTPDQLEKLRLERRAPSQAPASKPQFKLKTLADYEKVRLARRPPSQAPDNKKLADRSHAALEKLRGERHSPSQATSHIPNPK